MANIEISAESLRDQLNKGLTLQDIVDKYNVDHSSVSAIRNLVDEYGIKTRNRLSENAVNIFSLTEDNIENTGFSVDEDIYYEIDVDENGDMIVSMYRERVGGELENPEGGGRMKNREIYEALKDGKSHKEVSTIKDYDQSTISRRIRESGFYARNKMTAPENYNGKILNVADTTLEEIREKNNIDEDQELFIERIPEEDQVRVKFFDERAYIDEENNATNR